MMMSMMKSVRILLIMCAQALRHEGVYNATFFLNSRMHIFERIFFIKKKCIENDSRAHARKNHLIPLHSFASQTTTSKQVDRFMSISFLSNEFASINILCTDCYVHHHPTLYTWEPKSEAVFFSVCWSIGMQFLLLLLLHHDCYLNIHTRCWVLCVGCWYYFRLEFSFKSTTGTQF